ncbi:9629_t:CDS:2, partial [Cetraspora pellucida]
MLKCGRCNHEKPIESFKIAAIAKNLESALAPEALVDFIFEALQENQNSDDLKFCVILDPLIDTVD